MLDAVHGGLIVKSHFTHAWPMTPLQPHSAMQATKHGAPEVSRLVGHLQSYVLLVCLCVRVPLYSLFI